MASEPLLIRLIATAVGLILGAAPWLSRKQPAEWQGNVPMSRTSRVLFSAFGLSFALVFWIDGFLRIVVAAMMILMISWLVDHGRHRRAARRELRKHAATHPEVFDGPPPELEGGRLPAGDSFRLFDTDTGKLVGRLGREPLTFLIDRYREWELGDNDFFILAETIEMLEQAGAPDEFLSFIREALGERDSVELRWVLDDPAPATRDAKKRSKQKFEHPARSFMGVLERVQEHYLRLLPFLFFGGMAIALIGSFIGSRGDPARDRLISIGGHISFGSILLVFFIMGLMLACHAIASLLGRERISWFGWVMFAFGIGCIVFFLWFLGLVFGLVESPV